MGSWQTSEDALIWQEKKKKKTNQRLESRAKKKKSSWWCHPERWRWGGGVALLQEVKSLAATFNFNIRIQNTWRKVWQVSPVCAWERKQSQRAWRELNLNGGIVCVLAPFLKSPLHPVHACTHNKNITMDSLALIWLERLVRWEMKRADKLFHFNPRVCYQSTTPAGEFDEDREANAPSSSISLCWNGM